MTIRLVSLFAILIPVLLGLAKILVGLSRGRPVGILFALVIFTIVLGAIYPIGQPHRTRSGSVALKRAKSTLARAVRAPLPTESPLAFAVSGAVVLVGTP